MKTNGNSEMIPVVYCSSLLVFILLVIAFANDAHPFWFVVIGIIGTFLTAAIYNDYKQEVARQAEAKPKTKILVGTVPTIGQGLQLDYPAQPLIATPEPEVQEVQRTMPVLKCKCPICLYEDTK